MRMPTVFSCALVLASYTAGTAPAQEHIQYDPARRLEPITTAEPIPAPGTTGMTSTVIAPSAAPVTPVSHAELSSWITYHQPDCCEPKGGHGGIYMELYVRNGPSMPLSSGLEENLVVGWLIQGGGRSLFFNSRETAAWTVDLGLVYVQNTGQGSQVPFLVDSLPVTVRDMHRTAATFAIGRECYLIGSARSEGVRLRAGFDGGVRWGSTRLDLNDTSPIGFRRLNSWNWGPVASVHSDLEIPRGCCSCVIGIRAEWDQWYNNRFPGDFPHDVIDVNLLLTLGVRF